jgi:CheY-like chemotaxis protein
MEHSFTFSSFKIEDEKQLNRLLALSFPRLRYDPKCSDCRPLATAAGVAPAVIAKPAPPPLSAEELAAMHAKHARIKQLKALRRNLAEVNKKFQKANNTVKNIGRNLRSQPLETLQQAEELVAQMVDAMLGEETVLMHALNGKAGEDAYFHALNVTVLSIMLVEDNPINAILVRKLLERHHHQVVLAGNGKQAIELIAQQHFDLALMDMFMPEMDRLEATQLIRAAETDNGQHLSIIAMTANAMPSDREACLACLAAGIDGYISKPINRQQLYAQIHRVLTGEGPVAQLTEPNRSAVSATAFNYQTALSQVDPLVLQVIGAPFLASCRSDYLNKLQLALQQGNSRSLQLTARALKALLGSFCLSPAQQLAEQIEQLAEQGELAAAGDLLVRLSEQFERFLPLLPQHLNGRQ